MSIIAFVGSVFSPYYAWACERRGAAVRADDHCAINVALYGPAANRWCMTERGQSRVDRSRTQFSVGPSQVRWVGDELRFDIDERCAPIPHRIRGRVRVHPRGLSNFSAALDGAGRHRWNPVAPCARIEVELEHPRLAWQGEAYVDSNEGDEPVTGPFRAWDWSRARLRDGSTAVLYDVRQHDGSERVIAERFAPDGRSQPFAVPPSRLALPTTGWRVKRNTRGEQGDSPRVLRTLEDTPFYARSLIDARLFGERVTAVHETLQPARLKHWPVRLMLPWRMPRVR